MRLAFEITNKLFRLGILLISFSPVIAAAQTATVNVFTGNDKLNSLLIIMARNQQLNERINTHPDLGKTICEIGGGSVCTFVRTIGQGICRAGNGDACFPEISIAEGICKAGKGFNCVSVKSIREGICLAGGGSNCRTVKTIGEAFCIAAKGINCEFANLNNHEICSIVGEHNCNPDYEFDIYLDELRNRVFINELLMN